VRFAKEGLPFIAVSGAVAAAAVVYAATRGALPWGLIATVLLALAVWVAYFFRDPDRTGPRGDRLVISPADGIVLPIVQVEEASFVRGPALRISIFMNVFDVHVNRYPVSGVVRHVHYNPGRFLHAASDKASLDNEQRSVGIDTPAGRVLVRQIAGLVARRIVTYSRVEQAVEQGTRMGLIRFGSRVDVFVPPGSTVKVRAGERVSAGVTVLAEHAP
jgi:phosphatidylserine decarboxylase